MANKGSLALEEMVCVHRWGSGGKNKCERGGGVILYNLLTSSHSELHLNILDLILWNRNGSIGMETHQYGGMESPE